MGRSASSNHEPDYTVQLETIHSGFALHQKQCWVHSRAGVIPEKLPQVVLTMQRLYLDGSDVFGILNEMRTDDLGGSWTDPVEHTAAFKRRNTADGIQLGVCDFTPAWHEGSGKLLGTGHTVAYKEGGTGPYPHNRKPVYSVYHSDQQSWTMWKGMELPPGFDNAGAGSAQRVDLDNGDVLLPVYFKQKGDTYYSSTILRCQFDGETLDYMEHGTALSLPQGRGYYEPSIIKHDGQFLITLRADDRGAVASSHDGLHFDEPVTWTWDDGSKVPICNTQQHWISHHNDLYLVYTRKTDDNHHVFRYRAPLLMAKVDPEHLCLIRGTEQTIVPERGARLGNFGVVRVNEKETWITVCEWMQNGGAWGEEMWRKLRERFSEGELAPYANSSHMSGPVAKYGADNSVFVARIQWNKPKG